VCQCMQRVWESMGAPWIVNPSLVVSRPVLPVPFSLFILAGCLCLYLRTTLE